LSLFTELKRRNVFRVVLAYVVVAWLLLQIGDTLAPALRLPEWVTSLLAFFLILGFPLAIFFAWAYELTPEGIKQQKNVDRSASVTPRTGRQLDFVIIGLLAVAVAYFVFDKFAADKLRPVAEIVTTSTRQSIAVLPFLNMSPDPDQEYFSDGLSEEILNLLAKIPELRVTSRSSAFSFKGKDLKIADVGRELNVAHVLEGSVRKSGNQIRITAQLIDVKSDAHLWSETWDRDLENIFEIQDDIAQAVVAALQVRLLGKLPRVKVTSPDAYALYLQAMELIAVNSAASLDQAEGLLREVLEIDPDYAPAWIGLGSVYETNAEFTFRPMAESFERAREFAQRAIDIDPNISAAYALLGVISLNYDRDRAAAKQYFTKSLSFGHNDSDALDNSARLAGLNGDYEQAARFMHEAIVLDPFSAPLYVRLGLVQMFGTRRYEESADAFRRGVVLSPDSLVMRFGLGQALFLAGDLAAALVAFEHVSLDGFRLTGESMVHHALGHAEHSDAALAELIRIGSEEYGAQIAEVYAVRSEIELAIEWLESDYDNNDVGVNGSSSNPFLDSLRGNPRFEDFLKRPGLSD